MAALKKMIPGLPSLSFKVPGTKMPRFAISFPRFNLKLPSLKMPGFSPRFSFPSFHFSRCSAVVPLANKLNKALGGKSHKYIKKPNRRSRKPNRRRRRKPNRRRRRKPNRRRRRKPNRNYRRVSLSNQCRRKRDRRGSRQCAKWKNRHCKNHKWVQSMCQRTCCLHNRRPAPRPARRSKKSCAGKRDTRRYARSCRKWKTRYCKKHKFVRKNCKRTCCMHNRG